MKKRVSFILLLLFLALCVCTQEPITESVPPAVDETVMPTSPSEPTGSPEITPSPTPAVSPEPSAEAGGLPDEGGENDPQAEPDASGETEFLLPIDYHPLSNGWNDDCYAILADGTLIMWGDPDYSYLHGGTLEEPIVLMENASAVYGGRGPCLVIDRNGTLWGLGVPEMFQDWNPDADIDNPTEPVWLMDHVSMASVNQFYFLILQRDGTLWCYGPNGWGLFGDMGHDNKPTNSYCLAKLADNIVYADADSAAPYAITSEHKLINWENWPEESSKTVTILDDVVWCCRQRALTVNGELIAWEYNYDEHILSKKEVLMTDVLQGGYASVIKHDKSFWYVGSNNQFVKLADDVTHTCGTTSNLFVLKTDGTVWMYADETPWDVTDSNKWGSPRQVLEFPRKQ